MICGNKLRQACECSHAFMIDMFALNNIEK